MRDIWEEQELELPKAKVKRTKGAKFTWELDSYLLDKCQNLIKSQKFPKKYSSLGDLIKQAIVAYRVKKFTLTLARQLDNPTRQIGVRFPAELAEYYQTIPSGQRKEFIELVLINYLDNMKKGKKL